MKSLKIYVIIPFIIFATTSISMAYGTNSNNIDKNNIIAESIIEQNGDFFFVSKPYLLQSDPDVTILFHHVNFSLPYIPIPTPPGGIRSTTMIFPDGEIETLSKGTSNDTAISFSKHIDPISGFIRHTDNRFQFLVSIDSEPPLKQHHYGVKPENVMCDKNFILITKYTLEPACVSSETKQKLIERDWTKPN